MRRRALVCATPFVLGACTMVGTGVTSGPRPVPLAAEAAGSTPPETGTAPEAVTAQVVDVALEAIGTPYEWGGTDANGFDCSGLIRFAYGRAGIRIPRTSADQLRSGVPVSTDPAMLRSGDVLGFAGDPGGRADHVGLYIGAGEFIHSSSSGVRIANVREPYWRVRLVAARRVVS